MSTLPLGRGPQRSGWSRLSSTRQAVLRRYGVTPQQFDGWHASAVLAHHRDALLAEIQDATADLLLANRDFDEAEPAHCAAASERVGFCRERLSVLLAQARDAGIECAPQIAELAGVDGNVVRGWLNAAAITGVCAAVAWVAVPWLWRESPGACLVGALIVGAGLLSGWKGRGRRG